MPEDQIFHFPPIAPSVASTPGIPSGVTSVSWISRSFISCTPPSFRAAYALARQVGAATVRDLIGGASPMRQHCAGRLCAVDITPGGSTTLALPQPDEDLLADVTDGAGALDSGEGPISLGQYDVFIARPDAPALNVAAATEPLRLLAFYLPRFVPR